MNDASFSGQAAKIPLIFFTFTSPKNIYHGKNSTYHRCDFRYWRSRSS